MDSENVSLIRLKKSYHLDHTADHVGDLLSVASPESPW